MKKQAILVICMLVSACGGQKTKPDTASGVLEAVPENTAAETPIESPVPAAYEGLKKKLDELGYEGVGLEHETIEVIERLTTVFNDPVAANRKIKMIYTGVTNDYDPANESITLSGTAEAKEMTAFLKKKVPLKGSKAAPKRKK